MILIIQNNGAKNTTKMLLLIYDTIAISGIISFNFTQFGTNNTPTSTNISRYLYSKILVSYKGCL